MKTKLIKGFCPSLNEPIKAEDGLLFRLRPYMDYLHCDKLVSLCNLSMKYGNGIIELTNRGSIQIRGVKKGNHKVFLSKIFKNKIVKKETFSNNTNIIINPLWESGDQNFEVYEKIIKLQKKLPNLPDKFGFIVDLGNKLSLKNISADIRVESAPNKKILIRADGATKGKIVEKKNIGSFILKLTNWFIDNRDKDINRMSELLLKKKIPHKWTIDKPIYSYNKFFPKNTKIGQILGIKLGRVDANILKKLILKSRSPLIRFTPFKMILMEGVINIKDKNFIYKIDEPLLNISACSGKNFCSSASIDSHMLAKSIKNPLKKKIHIAACKKNCGINKNTQIILSGDNGFINIYDNLKKEIILKKISPDNILKRNLRDI